MARSTDAPELTFQSSIGKTPDDRKLTFHVVLLHLARKVSSFSWLTLSTVLRFSFKCRNFGSVIVPRQPPTEQFLGEQFVGECVHRRSLTFLRYGVGTYPAGGSSS